MSNLNNSDYPQNDNQICPKGQIYRKGYVRYRGNTKIEVSGNCITATSQSKQKRSDLDREYFAEREKMYKEARRKFSREMPKSCPPGKVLREGYYRQPTYRKAYKRSSGSEVEATEVRGAWVPPTCVPSINEQKKKRLFTLEKNVLHKYGYYDIKNLSSRERHRALNKALKDGFEPLPLLRRVNALFVLNKNRDPLLASKFKEDVDYIRNTKEYQNRPTARQTSTGSRNSRQTSTNSRNSRRQTSMGSRNSRRQY